MTDDKLTEALATAKWGWANADRTVRRLDGPDVHLIREAARRWRDFPTDDDVERGTRFVEEQLELPNFEMGVAMEPKAFVMRLLEAVKREDQ